MGAVIVKSTGTRIHGRSQHEARREGQRHRSPGDTDRTVLERLPHDFKNIARKLGKFVEEEHAIVGERDFPRTRNHAAANQSGVRNGVMRRAERTHANQPRPRIKHSGHAVNLGRLQGLFEGERRKDGGNALGEHCLPGAGRSDHQDVVAARAGNLQRALGSLLAADFLEIHVELLRFAQ